MQITAEIFRQIVGCTSDGSRNEKRTDPRVGLRFHALISPRSNRGAHTAVRIRDVSASGMGFLTARPMELGRTFLLHLPERNGAALELLFAVVRCRMMTDKLYQIGAVCLQPVPKASKAA